MCNKCNILGLALPRASSPERPLRGPRRGGQTET